MRCTVGCPDRRIDRSDYVCSSNLHTPDIRRDLFAAARRVLRRLAISQTIRAILLASAMAAILVGRRANNAVSQADAWCRGSWHSDDGERAGHDRLRNSGRLVC